MLVSDWLAGFPQRLQWRNKSRLRQRRSNPWYQLAAEVAVLEPRELLSSTALGDETLIHQPAAGVQQFSEESDRSIAVTPTGTVIAAWASPNPNGGGSRIMARMVDANGEHIGADFQVSTTAAGIRGNPSVGTYGSDKFVVVWESIGNAQDNSGWGVFARVFGGDGKALTSEFRINNSTIGNQQDASVAWLSADQFVVAWSGTGQGAGQTVFARVFNASGGAVTNEIRVPQSQIGAQQHPVVISLPGGGFQVAWSGYGLGDAYGIFTRQFNGAGQALGGEIRVNTSNTAVEQQPTIARNGGEQVIIAWQAVGNSQDQSGFGIMARRFSMNGTALGNEFRINETTVGSQWDPSIAFLLDGGFVVTWRGYAAADADGVYVRDFNSDGTARGPQRLVNTTTAGSQATPTVRMQGAAGFVVAFGGNVAGDPLGVALQSFAQNEFAMPVDTVGSAGEVMFNDPAVTALKTIILTNNTDRTVYPILRDANSRENKNPINPANKGKGLYDPYDPLNQEYRGYVGYVENGKTFLGLKAGQTIKISVPLVFWDGGRIEIATEGSLIAQDKDPTRNPFHYESNSKRFTVDAKEATGRVMWYHAETPQSPAFDAPTQLIEQTFRDEYLSTLPTAEDIPLSERHALINYDVSYVDTLSLPVAMEAADVPDPNNNNVRKPYGWIGAKMDFKTMQDAIAAFTASGPAGQPHPDLGWYFADNGTGKGYDRFYLPNEELMGLKIPAGQNLFGLSPLGDVRSSYDNNRYMLLSGGEDPIEAISGGLTHTNKTLDGLQAAIVANIKVGMIVTSSGNDIPAGTTVTKILSATSVELSQAATGSQGNVYTFTRPISDYVATRLTNLWYSWADFYAKNHAGTPQISRSSEVQPFNLTFTTPEEQAYADKFAAVVYDVMKSFSTIPPEAGSKASLSAQLMLNVIGCNVGKIPGIDLARSNEIRDEIKSILRGVVDFKVEPDESKWYPDPKLATGGANFNVYNLNPFVWFVHRKLGMSGYGFSVDDDVADVGADGATTLIVGIGGLNGLPNKTPWSEAKPFG